MSTAQPVAQTLAAFSDQLAEVVEHAGASVVSLHARRSYPASGLIWQPGVVFTAAHTIRRETGITAVLPSGATTTATLAGIDAGTDMAVLRLASTQGSPAALQDAPAIKPGHFVVAVARSSDGSLVSSGGLIARSGSEWRTWRGARIDRLIQLDGGLWPGFSGAPVIDASGKVIGIGTSALARGRAVVIPVSVLRRSGEQILAHGRVSEAYLGVAVQPVELPPPLRERLQRAGTHGLIVLSLAHQGPADQAGVMLGDILVALDSKPLTAVEDLKEALSDKSVGSSVKVDLVRGGALTVVDVTVGDRLQAR